MDGITFLRKLMHFRPVPVVVISSLCVSACQASMDALRAGAVEILCKPNGPMSVGELSLVLANTIRAAAGAKLKARQEDPRAAAMTPAKPVAAAVPSVRFTPDSVLAIGSSTGGPAAVQEVLAALPVNAPPVVVVQHMPPVFTKHFAQRLNQECAVEVREAKDGDELKPGLALVAPGDFHMTLERYGGGYRVRIATGPAVCFSRPSVDVLFSSVAHVAKRKALGVVLTGMGADGARGLLEMRNAGAMTIVQNEETCVVYGMPKEAVRVGAAQLVLPLNQIGAAAVKQLQISAAA